MLCFFTTLVVVMAQDYVLLTASASARELGFLVPPSDATKGRIPLSPRGEFFLPPWGTGHHGGGVREELDRPFEDPGEMQ